MSLFLGRNTRYVKLTRLYVFMFLGMLHCPTKSDFDKTQNTTYEFSHLFEPPVEASTSFHVGILAQKATCLGRLLDPGW
jgi:hypothetical protein